MSKPKIWGKPIGFRLMLTDDAKCRATALAAGKTLSEYVRDLVLLANG